MTLHQKPPAADYVRSFISFHKQGLLSTQSKRHEGFPFGSVVPYDVDSSGRIVISVSKISTHYQNLIYSEKGSLLVQQRYFEDRPRTGGRICLLLRFSDIPSEEYNATAQSYRKRYGTDAEFELAHDFVFKRGEVESVRWIAGFGRMGWLNCNEYTGGQVDCVAAAGLAAVEHMNLDHADAVSLLARSYGSDSIQSDRFSAQMVTVDSLGLSIRVAETDQEEIVFIPFDPPLETPSDLRGRIVSLVKEARNREEGCD